MESIELAKNMGIYNEIQRLIKEIAEKERELSVAEAMLKTQKKGRTDACEMGYDKRPDITDTNNSERIIERLKNKIENLRQKLQLEKAKIGEAELSQSEKGERKFEKN